MSGKLLVGRPAIASWMPAAMVVWLLVGGERIDAQQAPPEPEGIDVAWDTEDGDAEHLLRGPLHEAFAAPVPFDPEPGIIVPNEPPAPINEMPPEVRPEAESVWLEGYWAWDDQREEFIWISGVYRVAPPERRWVPGYWQEVDDGYQWNAGFWAPLKEDELSYLPDPPETVERGPSSPAPSTEHFWVNGHWQYDGGRYAWRPGYWARGHERWVWIPSHYVWTPHGCIFVRGYWDHRLTDRGMCFTPVYWRRPMYLQTGFYYRPTHLVDLARLHLHMFVRPRYYHYYYGDWYGVPRGRGIYASYNFHGRYGYDPLWNHYNWYFGQRGIDYSRRIRGWHNYFERHADRRPPHTWQAQRKFSDRHSDYEHLKQIVLGHRLQEFASENPRRVTRVAEQERDRLRESARAIRELRDTQGDLRTGTERGRRPDVADGRLRLPETPDVRHLRDRMSERATGATRDTGPGRATGHSWRARFTVTCSPRPVDCELL